MQTLQKSLFKSPLKMQPSETIAAPILTSVSTTRGKAKIRSDFPKQPDLVQTLFSKKPHQPMRFRGRDKLHQVCSRTKDVGVLLALDGLIPANEPLGQPEANKPHQHPYKHLCKIQPHKPTLPHCAAGTAKESCYLPGVCWGLFCLARAHHSHPRVLGFVSNTKHK